MYSMLRRSMKYYTNQYKSAIDDLTTAANLDRQCSLVYFNRALCQQALGNTERVCKCIYVHVSVCVRLGVHACVRVCGCRPVARNFKWGLRTFYQNSGLLFSKRVAFQPK